jgi:hypothetical protein
VSKIIPKNIEFAVVSPGGVATTSLIHFFARNHTVNAPNDEDSLKHMPVPPVSFNPAFKYIHVFGDPVDATLSLFRRRFQELQSKKLQRGTKLRNPIPLEMSVEEYAYLGRDLLQFENFFDNYYSKHLLYPTLFIRYERLWDNLEMIREFLGLPEEEIALFPPKWERKANKGEIDPTLINRLKKMYSGFYEKINDLPDAFVRGQNLKRSKTSLLFSHSFNSALKNGARSKVKPYAEVYGF